MAAKKPLVLDSAGNLQQIQAADFIPLNAGGTGSTTAAGARTNLGLRIGVDVQAYSDELTGVAALAAGGIVARTGAGAYSARTIIPPTAGITVTNGDATTGNPTLGLSNDLAAVEGLSTIGFAVRTAVDTWATRSIVSGNINRITVSNTDGAAANPSIDLALVSDAGGGSFLKFTRDGYGRITGTSAVAASDISGLVDTRYLQQSGGTLTGFVTLHADPTNAMHAVTKQYADAIAEGRRDKPAVKCLQASNINVAAPGTSTFDGIVCSAGDRILLVGQTAGAENGPWVFNGPAAALTRPVDFNTSSEVVSGATYFVDVGSNYADSNWTLISSGPYTLGTTALTFTQTSSLGQVTAGNGLAKSGNTISVVTTARLTFSSGQLDLVSGVVAGLGTGTFTKFTVDTYGRITSTATATPADIGAQPSSTELTALAALSATGHLIRTGSGAYAIRTLTQPASGLTITNADGTGGNPTFALANDLAALEALGGTGIAVRTAADAWAQRSIATAAAGRITVANGDGVSGNPTLDLASGIVTPGTYTSVTVDTYGRVVAGGAAGSAPTDSILTNDEATTVAIANAVYIDAAGGFKKAIANADAPSKVVGLTLAGIGAAAGGTVRTTGEVSATTGEWDAVTGQTGGLTFGADYYLDNATAGRLTTTAPSSGYVVKVGRALSATKMVVAIGPRVQL